jgi:hypothetical protein
MRPFARYFTLILCTLALVGGGTFADVFVQSDK